jgi:quercetin dioxygenase-like cupin family protein
MARVIGPESARRLGLPGRASYEILSGAMGSQAVTLRRVEIPVAADGTPHRGRHRHGAFEECIYVLSGRGTAYAGDTEFAVKAGDTIHIPAGEAHITRNTGTELLVLLCFFPVADVSRGTEEGLPLPK